MKYKNILVTGAAGLLGRSVIELLIKKGYKVIALDINPPNFEKATCVQGDFCNENLMKFILKDVDAVFHFAAMLGVDQCRLHPEQVIKVNYEDTKKFVKLCLNQGIKKIIFTSSSEVYGNSKEIPYKENAKLNPVSTYGKSKMLTEKYLTLLHKTKKIKIGIARLFNVYGFNQRNTFVIPIFIDLALKNKPLTIFGDGEQIRCFTYVEDAVKGLVKFLEYEKNSFEIINIGKSQEYTMKQTAKIILKSIPKSKSKIIYIPYGTKGVREEGLEIRRRVPSVEKAKRLLNFEATISLEKGIKKIIKKYEEYFHRPIP
jgi:UDP-glucose 4-epimerase